MANREDLHALLLGILGSNNAYFQPPESVKMKYPCFVYTIETTPIEYADDVNYKTNDLYLVKYICREPAEEIRTTLAKTKGFRFDRYYVADNLHHYVYTYTFY